MLDVRVCFRMDGLSERDFDGYINFRIILFHIPLTVFRLEFTYDILNPITICYWFTTMVFSVPFTEIFKFESTNRFLYQLVSEP